MLGVNSVVKKNKQEQTVEKSSDLQQLIKEYAARARQQEIAEDYQRAQWLRKIDGRWFDGAVLED